MAELNKQNYLLIVLLEEASEVQKAITKAIRFGLMDVKPATQQTNKAMIADELSDMQGVIELLKEECGIEITTSRSTVNDKKRRVRRYMDYSRKVGKLEAV